MAYRSSSRVLGLLLLVGVVTTGCSRVIDVKPSPAAVPSSAPFSIGSEERVPLILDAAKITHNGSPQNPSSDLDRRFLSALQDLSLFSQLSLFDTAPATEKAIVARLSVNDTIDSHPGEAAWKGVVLGASMFLLAPVMELHYDYGTHLTLELERWDGTVKTYSASSSGTARYNLFAASPDMITELKGHVLETGITDLMEQLVKDTAFYNASSAPVNERTIYSVSVKSKRRTPAARSIPTSSTTAAR